MIKNEIAEPAAELAECIEEQLESSSEDLGEIEADPDKETFDHKNEVSDYESDPLGLISSTPPSPAACMDEIKEESIHSEPGKDEELANSDTEDPRTLDDANDITDKERVEIITSIKSGDLSQVVCSEKITEESLHNIVDEDEEIKINKETSVSFDELKEELGKAMEVNTYKKRLAEV